jgi:hypothetical protein
LRYSGHRLKAPRELLPHRGIDDGRSRRSYLSLEADALDTEIEPEPVPKAPYLVVTSRGPLCRETLTDGRRLVVELAVFAVERQPSRYRFRDPTVEECLQVSPVTVAKKSQYRRVRWMATLLF